ncbi:MAPEG family protein [Kordiimonas lipolytica]|uniref:MAPEG family protein n=1 Tax=Kordiimonas lipolytica TaxID=1662421 RepID=A0ABV8UEN1_9PROT|nr:MAPEG family protein [Kordiimonas lipolytica]
MTITIISASFLGLLLFYLSYNVAKNRGRAKVSIGDGGDEGLQNAIRAHANLIEYAPMAMILIGLLEYRGVNSVFLIVLSAFFVVGRYMHGLTFGKFEGRNPFRFWGTVFTWLVILIASVVGLLSGYGVI